MTSGRPSPVRSAGRCLLLGLGAAAVVCGLVVLRPTVSGTTLQRGDELAGAVAWFAAVMAGAYLAVVASACALALAAGRPRLAARLSRRTPVVRRIVEVAAASSWLALSTMPAASALNGPRSPIVHDVPVVRAPVPVGRAVTQVPRARPRTRPDAATPPRIHLVRAGDNLWLIARETLVAAGHRLPTDIEIAHYWRAVITQNRATLRSRDPSLIYPGEIVTLPPVK